MYDVTVTSLSRHRHVTVAAILFKAGGNPSGHWFMPTVLDLEAVLDSGRDASSVTAFREEIFGPVVSKRRCVCVCVPGCG